MSFYRKLEENEQLLGLSEESMLELDKLMDRYLVESSGKTADELDLSLKYFVQLMYNLWDKSQYSGKNVSGTAQIKLFPQKFKQTETISIDELDPAETFLIEVVKNHVDENRVIHV